MERNKYVFFRKSIAGLLFIGMAVQIAVGIIWIFCNFPTRWQFAETEYYVKAAASIGTEAVEGNVSIILDEYTGLLYPLVIRVVESIMKPFGLSCEALLVLLQLAAAVLCYCLFWWLCGAGSRLWSFQNIFMGLYLLTVPLSVQWHLTVLPLSFTSSLYLLLFGLCIRAYRRKEHRNMCLLYQVSGIWAAVTLLEPDYWYLAIPMVLFATVLACRKKGWKRPAQAVLLLAAVSLLAGSANRLAQTPSSSGRIQKSLGAAMVSRLVWPNFGTNYFYWPEEIKAIMTEEQGTEISRYADNVQLIFGPMTEQAYGRQKADALYWQMALRCLQDRTKEVVTAVSGDFLAYLFTPWRVKDQLDGSGISYSGWNYSKMRSAVPGLTKWYMDYGLVSFRFGIVIALLCGLAGLLFGKCAACAEGRRLPDGGPLSCEDNRRSPLGRGIWLFTVVCVLWQALWYTMSGAGMMDYKNVLPVILLWYGAIGVAWHYAGKVQY